MMQLFRRHTIYGPPAGIPPQFERGEIEHYDDGEPLAAWHGFMPVYEVEDILTEAMSELRRLAVAKCIEQWDFYEISRIADRIERLLADWESLDEAERA